MTGDLSPFVSRSESLTRVLKTDEVSRHARSTADTASSFSSAKASDIIIECNGEDDGELERHSIAYACIPY